MHRFKTWWIALTALTVFVAFCIGLSVLKRPVTFASLDVVDDSSQAGSSLQETQEMTLLATGDIMYHSTQILKTNGSYDFEDNFKYVSSYIQNADLAVANFESTTTTAYPYSGYPQFNTPKEAVASIKNAGFDVVSTVNNHSLDTGKAGLLGTLQAFQEAGVSTVGTMSSRGDGIVWKEVNGITIAFLAYSYGFNGLLERLDEDERWMVNALDEVKIEADIRLTKKQGADFTVVFAHWGQEYRTEPTIDQEELAHKMVNWGANVVLGSHPHVIERSEMIKVEDEQRYIIYSLGNFISDQRLESVNDINTERGVMVELTLRKTGSVNTVSAVTLIPTWVYKYSCPGRYCYQVLPALAAAEGSLDLNLSESLLKRIRSAYTETVKRIKGTS